jgi:hypothetical protein
MKNTIILFMITVLLFTALFIFKDPYVIVLIILNTFFILVYAMAKIKALETVSRKYSLEHKRCVELEQELLKEIDMSNSIMIKSRSHTAPLGNNSG